MKTRKNTYLLLGTVALIWGIIGYKIIRSLSPREKGTETEALVADFRPQTPRQQDTFRISVHERDPFLGDIIAPRPAKKPSGTRKTVPKAEEAPQIPVAFSGMITDKSSKEKLFFVSIHNRQYLMNINDEVEQVKLVKGNAQSIRIRYNNQLKTIPITK